jgi:hypothetical protein
MAGKCRKVEMIRWALFISAAGLRVTLATTTLAPDPSTSAQRQTWNARATTG